MSQRTLPTILIVPAVAVFLVLAFLLYRWSTQVSQATSVRLADSLQMSMVNWHLNLFRDLADIAMAMRVDPDSGRDLAQYPRRLDQWRSAAPYPDLVRDLYVLDGGGEPSSLRFDVGAGRFVSATWPDELEELRDELSEAAKTELAAGDALYFPAGAADWWFEPGTPALLRPIEAESGDWLVLTLDADVIRERVLPDLARRYFMGVDSLDYLVAVVSGGEPRQVVYSSDPGFGAAEVQDADGRMDVFGDMIFRQMGSPIHVFHELSEDARITGLAASIGTSWFPLIQQPGKESGWQLIVRHRRGGALGAFVAEMHRRDLAISFGTLSLLVLTVAMLIVTSLRANRLGRLQMEFVTAVSHELRSPLTIIASAAENLVHGVVAGRDQIVRYGSVIEGQTRRLSRLVEEILLFAATRERRERYELRNLEVHDVVDAALSATTDLVEASGFTVETDVPDDLPRVRGDLGALSQCLQNLITNALKYSESDRWIGIRAHFDNGGAGSAQVRISVSNHGIGIAPEDLPRVFEPFYRGSRARTAQIHGTGLGLALAKSIAEAMDGLLTASSDPNEGTTFTLHLPCVGEEQPQDVPIRQESDRRTAPARPS